MSQSPRLTHDMVAAKVVRRHLSLAAGVGWPSILRSLSKEHQQVQSPQEKGRDDEQKMGICP